MAANNVLIWDSGSTASAVDTGVRDYSDFTTVSIMAVNGASATRNLTLTFYADDGTTAIITWVTAVAISGNEGVLVGPTVTGQASPLKVQALGFLPRKMKIAWAANAAAGRVFVTAR